MATENKDSRDPVEAHEQNVPARDSVREQDKNDAKAAVHHAVDTAREGTKHIARAKDHAFDSISEELGIVGERARVVGESVSDFVATHAIPLTLLGAGAGWVLVSMRHQRRASVSRSIRGGGDGYDEPGFLATLRERGGEISDRATGALVRTPIN